jgi:hypothetical protein
MFHKVETLFLMMSFLLWYLQVKDNLNVHVHMLHQIVVNVHIEVERI